MNRRPKRKNHMRSLRHNSRKLLNSFANYQTRVAIGARALLYVLKIGFDRLKVAVYVE
jgi:hypothetical protein